MSFDRETRNALARTVARARERLKADAIEELRRLGFQDDGTVLDLDRIAGLSDADRAAAEELRALLDHYSASESGLTSSRRQAAYDRLAREIGFTTLNRLVALRLAEERGLIVQAVGGGLASAGFQIFERVANGALGTRAETYRAYLESLYDEIAVDLPLLFDRAIPGSYVFPGERCLDDVLKLIADPALAHLWKEDETIGWVYQYYNDPDERRKMRESSAPRNSRELAVRNQFFTPRYVVEFLTDNTLGRTWYEMRQGDTRLTDDCRYLVRRPREVFLKPAERPPDDATPDDSLTTEERLLLPFHVPFRAMKDPRDLKVLDPACGSGHFLLYAFDLLETIYEEAWDSAASPQSEATHATLSDDYPDLDALRRAVPALILRHNLNGVEIDPRALQIAALALWLRAQRTYQRLGLRTSDRPPIIRSNLVCASPMPGEREMLEEFLRGVDQRLRPLVRTVWDKLQLAGEAGSLLKIEEEIAESLYEARRAALVDSPPYQVPLLERDQRPVQIPLTLATEEEQAFWAHAEQQLLDALRDYATRAEYGLADSRATQRRLFADDAAQGFSLIDLCRHRFDVVLMNPPFGAASAASRTYIDQGYPRAKNDVYAAFVERGLSQLNRRGLLGAISGRNGFFHSALYEWRARLLTQRNLECVADLGGEILDSAFVETASYILQNNNRSSGIILFLDVRHKDDKGGCLYKNIQSLSKGSPEGSYSRDAAFFLDLPKAPLAYRATDKIRRIFTEGERFESQIGNVRLGLRTLDDFRYVRLCWEVPAHQTGWARRWVTLNKGGSFARFYFDFQLLLDWYRDGAAVKAAAGARYGSVTRIIQAQGFYGLGGLTYPRRSQRGFCVRALPSEDIFTDKGVSISLIDNSNKSLWLGILNSTLIAACVEMQSGSAAYEAGYVQRLPALQLEEFDATRITDAVDAAVEAMRRLSQRDENSRNFVSLLSVGEGDNIHSFNELYRRLLHAAQDADVQAVASTDAILSSALGLDSNDEQTLAEILAVRDRPSVSSSEGEDEDGDEVATLEGLHTTASSAQAFLSYALGCAFGRWDVRIALDSTLVPRLPDPFDPLPVCSPGTLVGPDAMPATPNSIASEEWLRERPDAITLPSEGAVQRPGVSAGEYPLRVTWDGILVDDLDHSEDVVRRAREVLAVLWGDRADAIEAEACGFLGVRDLRDYFRRPGSFFADHLKCYSKSRRQAPIYWPLSTSSGRYTLWIYYHRLTSDTLYLAVNRFVEPKMAEVQRDLGELERRVQGATGREATRLRDQIEAARGLLSELGNLRQELLRVAALPYRPNLDDGVIINAAPLHKLFRLPKWAKDTRECWGKLERGDYDWAHLAYTVWPERVQEKCRRDRSLAIAHDLEDLYEEGE
jgi:hypothetical protein